MTALRDLRPHGRGLFLLGRLLGYRALEACEGWQDEEHEPAFAAFRARLNHETTAVLESGKEQQLHGYLSALPRRAGDVPLRHAQVVARIVVEFDGHVTAYVTASDDPFEQIFERALRATRELYALCDASEVAVPPLELRVTPDGRLHDFASLIQVTGVATAERVALTYTAQRFCLDEFRASDYVLFHELVVHSFGHPAVLDGPHGSFAEGWMDQIALELHDAELGDAAGTGRGLQDARLSGLSLGSGLRRRGQKAAFRLRDAIGDVVGDEARRRQETWRLSGALNRSELDHRQREDLTDLLVGPDHEGRIRQELARYLERPPTPINAIADATAFAHRLLDATTVRSASAR